MESMAKKPALEMLLVYNTQHLSRKAPPPPGTVVAMKNLSQAQAKLELVRQVGVMARKNPHPLKARHHGPPLPATDPPPEQHATQRQPPVATGSHLVAGQ
jgi:hypothetical protein